MDFSHHDTDPGSRLDESRSQRILWLLEELKLPYTLEMFRRNKETKLAPPELEKVHPLGKSPIISVTPAGAGEGVEPVMLAESGFITQYLTEHCPEGKRLMPPRWKEGMEGKIGGETEAWMRYQYYLHYCEGSLMPVLVMSLIVGGKSTHPPPSSLSTNNSSQDSNPPTSPSTSDPSHPFSPTVSSPSGSSLTRGATCP